MEDVIARMQDEKNGIPIRTVKSFLSKIPSVFSGKFTFSIALFCPESFIELFKIYSNCSLLKPSNSFFNNYL